MNEVKTPKKPLISYYCVVILLLLLFNMLVMPTISQRQVKEVDYNTFMEMTYNDNIGKVELQDNQILFTDKDNKQVYKTGLMSDPELTQRLYDHGAQFASEIQEQMSPVLSFLLSWVLPIVIFRESAVLTTNSVVFRDRLKVVRLKSDRPLPHFRVMKLQQSNHF